MLLLAPARQLRGADGLDGALPYNFATLLQFKARGGPMHVHILGICGTFMGGVAALARSSGHRVTGSDQNVYPPMSDQLVDLGIELTVGFDAQQLQPRADTVVVGNVMSRGMPVVEAVLDQKLDYCSGPQWLAEHVLRSRRVLAVAGTHGKTTTSSLLAWILEYAGLKPGFLIGGIAQDFGVSACLGEGEFFVIEADEYDTAFFDKRAKFLHYRPEVCIINNLEFDHADIYADLAAIQWQFHQLLRTVPGTGCIVARAGDENLNELFAQGCWTPRQSFASDLDQSADWIGRPTAAGLELFSNGKPLGCADWQMSGTHNAENATAALAAAVHVGVDPRLAIEAIGQFRGVKRRLELHGRYQGVALYDDFAHHPTAIARTIDGLCQNAEGRLLVVFEPRSNTMRMGVHRKQLAAAFAQADAVWIYNAGAVEWDIKEVFSGLDPVRVCEDISAIVAEVAAMAAGSDRVVVMSNGGFGGIHQQLAEALAQRD